MPAENVQEYTKPERFIIIYETTHNREKHSVVHEGRNGLEEAIMEVRTYDDFDENVDIEVYRLGPRVSVKVTVAIDFEEDDE